jgi:hypothetical protein
VRRGAPGGQRGPGVPRLAVRPQHLAGPDQGLEGVRQRDHLAGAANRPARHRRGEAIVEPVAQEPAQLRADAGVAAQQVAEAGDQQRPRLRGRQPRRAADRPAEQQVALVAGLRRLVEVDGRGGCRA